MAQALLIALPLAFAVRDSVALQRRRLALLPVEARTLALETRGEFRPGDKVIARKPHFAFYAGLTPVPFPFADSLSQIAAVARAGRALAVLLVARGRDAPRGVVPARHDVGRAGLRVVRAVQDHPAVLYEILPGFGPEAGLVRGQRHPGTPSRPRATTHRPNQLAARVYVALYERRLEHWDAAQKLLDEALPWAGEDPELLLLTADNLAATEAPAPPHDARPRRAARRRRSARRAHARAGSRPWTTTGRAPRWWRPLIEYTDDARTLFRMHDVFAAVKDGAAQAAVDAKLRARGLKP